MLNVAFTIASKDFSFLVDTGAIVSLIPPQVARALRPATRESRVRLKTADGSPLAVYGECVLELASKKLRRTFRWNFVIANVSQPILGSDFLTHHNLLVDCRHKRLIDSETNIFKDCAIQSSTAANHLANVTPLFDVPADMPPDVSAMLTGHASLLSPPQYDADSPDSGPNTTNHVIETSTNRPIFAKARQLTPDKYNVAKSEFDAMLNTGIIRTSNSPWASPLHMVPKKNNQWRPCGDYRRLNAITKADRYPVPNITSLSSKLHGSKFFSKLDIVKAYYNIPMHEDDVAKTAIITPFGLFEFLRMPFGLRNAAQTFQRYMDNIFRQCNYAFVYIDDILIFSDTYENHLSHIESLFSLLHVNNLKISLDKCVFCVPEITFLGHGVTPQGVSPSSDKASAISEFPKPDDYAALRRFIGMINFYRRFIPQFADITTPLFDLLGSTNQKNHTLTWTPESERSFENIKEALATSTNLSHVDHKQCSYHLVTDASNFAIGAALHQMVDGEAQPLGFYSKKLSGTQKTYSAFDRELLAAYLAVLHFKPLIEGRNVTLFTDHNPLVKAFYSQTPARSDRQQRHLTIVSEYVSVVEYIKGSDNIVADTLSRSVNTISLDFPDLEQVAAAQEQDTEIESYKDRLRDFPLPSGRKIVCDDSLCHPRPFLPLECRKRVFDHLHGLSHPGIAASYRMISSRYFWPNMNKDVKQWAKECLDCQQSKVTSHHHSDVQHNLYPFTDRFQTIHMDIVGPLPPSKTWGSTYTADCRYLITFIDRATRWFECIPTADMTSETIVNVFLQHWVSRFGVPLTLVTDQGRQFESFFFAQVSELIGFHRLRTSAYHPQSNGMVERFHRTLKAALKARKEEWLIALPTILLGLRCLPNENGLSPFTAVTGSTLLAPNALFADHPKSSRDQLQAVTALAKNMTAIDFCTLSRGLHNARGRPPSKPLKLDITSHVWVRIDRVRHPLEAPYQGPYPVISCNDKVVSVKLPNGKMSTISIDRIKIAHLHTPVSNTHPTHIATPPMDSSQKDTRKPDPPTNNTRRTRKTVRFAL